MPQQGSADCIMAVDTDEEDGERRPLLPVAEEGSESGSAADAERAAAAALAKMGELQKAVEEGGFEGAAGYDKRRKLWLELRGRYCREDVSDCFRADEGYLHWRRRHEEEQRIDARYARRTPRAFEAAQRMRQLENPETEEEYEAMRYEWLLLRRRCGVDDAGDCYRHGELYEYWKRRHQTTAEVQGRYSGRTVSPAEALQRMREIENPKGQVHDYQEMRRFEEMRYEWLLLKEMCGEADAGDCYRPHESFAEWSRRRIRERIEHRYKGRVLSAEEAANRMRRLEQPMREKEYEELSYEWLLLRSRYGTEDAASSDGEQFYDSQPSRSGAGAPPCFIPGEGYAYWLRRRVREAAEARCEGYVPRSFEDLWLRMKGLEDPQSDTQFEDMRSEWLLLRDRYVHTNPGSCETRDLYRVDEDAAAFWSRRDRERQFDKRYQGQSFSWEEACRRMRRIEECVTEDTYEELRDEWLVLSDRFGCGGANFLTDESCTDRHERHLAREQWFRRQARPALAATGGVTVLLIVCAAVAARYPPAGGKPDPEDPSVQLMRQVPTQLADYVVNPYQVCKDFGYAAMPAYGATLQSILICLAMTFLSLLPKPFGGGDPFVPGVVSCCFAGWNTFAGLSHVFWTIFVVPLPELTLSNCSLVRWNTMSCASGSPFKVLSSRVW
eukprot:TRINITY_DN37869_c0_g1_i1.p1 TRINITY_DN37869_c0_g1~~TRINITY_DN37869_c0_g1_i1.p1  ORF type:complete len:692 (+),score=143.97 TRINITY_DN37869_c0_g1_i1:74-2077(+)